MVVGVAVAALAPARGAEVGAPEETLVEHGQGKRPVRGRGKGPGRGWGWAGGWRGAVVEVVLAGAVAGRCRTIGWGWMFCWTRPEACVRGIRG